MAGKTNCRARARTALLLAGLAMAQAAWAGDPSARDWIPAPAVSYTHLIAFRMLFAMPFFAAVAWHQSRLAARGEIVVMTWKERIQVCLLGLLGYYLSTFLDFLGLRYITASLERLILFLSHSLVVLISAFCDVYKRQA